MNYYQQYKARKINKRLKLFEDTPMADFPSVGTPPPHPIEVGVLKGTDKIPESLFKRKPLWRDN